MVSLLADVKEREKEFKRSLDFILSHFEDPIWPRTMSTHTTERKHVLVYSEDQALTKFSINAFWHPFGSFWIVGLIRTLPILNGKGLTDKGLTFCSWTSTYL